MQSAFCRLLSLLCLCLLSGAVRAELPLLDLRRADVDTVPAVRLLEDASGQLSLYQARSRLLSEGRELRGVPSLGWSESAWWLGLKLQGRAGERYYLWLDHTFLDDVQLWVFVGDQLQLYRQVGDRLPFSRREEPVRAFMLPLPTLGSAPQELYLRVSSSSSIGLPLKLIPA